MNIFTNRFKHRCLLASGLFLLTFASTVFTHGNQYPVYNIKNGTNKNITYTVTGNYQLKNKSSGTILPNATVSLPLHLYFPHQKTVRDRAKAPRFQITLTYPDKSTSTLSFIADINAGAADTVEDQSSGVSISTSGDYEALVVTDDPPPAYTNDPAYKIKAIKLFTKKNK